MNLAIADILMTLFTIPLTFLDIMDISWSFSEADINWVKQTKTQLELHSYIFVNQDVVCKIKTTLESSSIYFSSFSILLLAYDRFLIIVRNHTRGLNLVKVLKPHFTKSDPLILHQQTMSFSIGAYIFSLAIVSPLTLATKNEIHISMEPFSASAKCVQVLTKASPFKQLFQLFLDGICKKGVQSHNGSYLLYGSVRHSSWINQLSLH